MRPETAYRLLHDEEVAGLFAELRAELLEQFARTPVDRTDDMVRTRMMLQCLDGLRAKIESRAYDYKPPQ